MSTNNASEKLEIMLLNAEAESVSSSDLYIWLRESGLPSEVAIRLRKLIEITVELAGSAINVGKIIILKLIEFVKAHPNFAVGIALGAAIGLLTGAIPFLGPVLAPIAATLGIAAGALVGHRLDKNANGIQQSNSTQPLDIAADVIEITKEFFRFLIDTFNAVFENKALKVINNG